MTGKRPYDCEKHGMVCFIHKGRTYYLVYCPICKWKELERKALFQQEEIGLLQAEVEILKGEE